MGLFYVTVLGFFFWEGDGLAIAGFAVLFEGVLGNAAFLMWCFCGEVVVGCVVIVVFCVVLFSR